MKIDGERKGDQERIRKGDGEVKNPKKTISLLGRLGGSGAATKGCQEGRENLGDGTQKLEKTQDERFPFPVSPRQYLYNPVISNLRVAVRSHRI